MQLNQEGRARLQQHLQTFLRQPCSLCGTGNWQVEDALFELREFVGGGVPEAGSQMQIKPLVAMTCNTCGHTVLMSPLKTGIIGVSQQAQPQQVVTEEIVEEEA
ncbi:MAG TPA: hypothetical protein VGM92_05320 [Candidatus Kapabacteria bacterium]|jgi:hypothetical protein